MPAVEAGWVVWFTGLPGAGKSTLAQALAAALGKRGVPCQVLDGDHVRASLWPELGFARHERDANVLRLATLAGMLSRHGIWCLVAAVSPYRETRARVREVLPRLVEVYVDAPLAVVEARDPKGLYARARRGEVPAFTGVSDPYEPPLSPDVHVRTDREGVEACVGRILQYLQVRAGLGGGEGR